MTRTIVEVSQVDNPTLAQYTTLVEQNLKPNCECSASTFIPLSAFATVDYKLDFFCDFAVRTVCLLVQPEC